VKQRRLGGAAQRTKRLPDRLASHQPDKARQPAALNADGFGGVRRLADRAQLLERSAIAAPFRFADNEGIGRKFTGLQIADLAGPDIGAHLVRMSRRVERSQRGAPGVTENRNLSLVEAQANRIDEFVEVAHKAFDRHIGFRQIGGEGFSRSALFPIDERKGALEAGIEVAKQISLGKAWTAVQQDQNRIGDGFAAQHDPLLDATDPQIERLRDASWHFRAIGAAKGRCRSGSFHNGPHLHKHQPIRAKSLARRRRTITMTKLATANGPSGAASKADVRYNTIAAPISRYSAPS